ncbi:hypothetical protein CA850_29510 [Micromonospora echinospora]|uniref:Uncharacterized protein n=1 Tax=Micromonospora echinospora TaxID=1877 RepID=A0A1C4VI83_MICEC|nr:hypothetical protein [Micromonospora echinospora]OZV74992.1 hypothetical protein CA850_29510 [Micromonospora echinospora]SCE83692.1 hypothetical protein GA0070618_1288 [Micromonospora echinospora]
MNRLDNPQGGPQRPFRVAREDLEQALRETLARQADTPRPLAVDPAGQAVRRAERLQRRRTLTGVALAAVATVAVSTGMAQLNTDRARYTSPTVVLGDPVGPPATSTVPSVRLDGPAFAGLSLVVGSTLVVDGRGTDLGGIGPVERGLRTGDGWLFVGTPGAAGRTVWAVGGNGTSRVLLAGADAVAVDPTGRRLAWRDGAELLVASVVNGQLLPGLRTPVPESAAPVGFVGDDVLVRVRPDRAGFALWRADGSPFQAGADRRVLDVYGRLPDGRLVARVTASPRPCLALLDPARALAVSATGCPVPAIGDGPGSVSPDGRWLLVNAAADSRSAETTALLVDLATAFGAEPVTRPVGPAVAGPAVWPAAEAAYPAVDGTLVRFEPDRNPARAIAALVPGLPAGLRPALVAAASR